MEEIKVVDERLQRVACCVLRVACCVLNDNEAFMKLKRLIEVLCSDDFEILCSDDFSRLLAKRLKSLLRGSAKRLKSLLRGSSALVTMLASEEALRRDWDSPEEDAAWAHL